MLKIVRRISDGEIMPWRQDSPNHRPGIMETAIAQMFGGSPTDYEGVMIPGKDKPLYMTAKTLKWDKNKKRVKAIPYSGKEKKAKKTAQEVANIEYELIQAQMYVDAAAKVGVDVSAKKSERDALKVKHEALING